MVRKPEDHVGLEGELLLLPGVSAAEHIANHVAFGSWFRVRSKRSASGVAAPSAPLQVLGVPHEAFLSSRPSLLWRVSRGVSLKHDETFGVLS